MNAEIEKLVQDYYGIENQIRKQLRMLKNYGKECDCDDSEEIELLNDVGEMEKQCLDCGGNITW